MNTNEKRPKRLQRAVRDLLIIAATTVALLAVIEVALRTLSSESNDVYRHHDIFGMAIGASVRSKFDRPSWHGGETIWWQTNSRGFRGDELVDNADMRVVVYGDSNIFAMFSDYPNTFTAKLEDALVKLSGQKIEVVNAGTVGYGPDQNLLRFESEAKELKPDLVIFHVFADNDFGDLIRNRLFQLDGTGLVRSQQPPSEDSYLNAEPKLHLLRTIFRWRRDLNQKMFGSENGPIVPRHQRGLSPDERSQAVISNLLEQRRQEFKLYEAGAPRRFSYLSDEYDIDVAVDPKSLAALTKVELMDAVLSRAWNFSRAKKIPLMILIQPSVSDLTSLRPIHAAHLKNYPEYDPERLTSLIEKIGESHEIPTLNLYDIFAQNNPDRLFFLQDVHWNDAGQHLAAAATADYVKNTFLVGE